MLEECKVGLPINPVPPNSELDHLSWTETLSCVNVRLAEAPCRCDFG